jgi:hypothetical protein
MAGVSGPVSEGPAGHTSARSSVPDVLLEGTSAAEAGRAACERSEDDHEECDAAEQREIDALREEIAEQEAMLDEHQSKLVRQRGSSRARAC